MKNSCNFFGTPNINNWKGQTYNQKTIPLNKTKKQEMVRLIKHPNCEGKRKRNLTENPIRNQPEYRKEPDPPHTQTEQTP